METRPASLLPEQFGPLQGVRIVSSGTLVAQPFAAALAAEMGAEVIQIERTGEGDAAWRHLGMQLPTTDGQGQVATTWIQERRNEWYVTLDFSQPEGKDLFLKAGQVVRHLDGEFKARLLYQVGPDRRGRAPGQPQARHRPRLRLRSERSSGTIWGGPRTT